jgi:hypothetical protein
MLAQIGPENPYAGIDAEQLHLVSIREHLESDESPVIRLWWSDSQEWRDVDVGEPASV